jgi:vacuolar-type H+-ATPase subunit H
LSKKTAKTGNLPKLSSNFNEIEKVRTAESQAAASIETARKSIDEHISTCHKESNVLYESALSQLRTELEENYISEENKVHQESKEIINGAETQAEQTKIKASVKIPEAVDKIIQKIIGGGA